MIGFYFIIALIFIIIIGQVFYINKNKIEKLIYIDYLYALEGGLAALTSGLVSLFLFLNNYIIIDLLYYIGSLIIILLIASRSIKIKNIFIYSLGFIIFSIVELFIIYYVLNWNIIPIIFYLFGTFGFIILSYIIDKKTVTK